MLLSQCAHSTKPIKVSAREGWKFSLSSKPCQKGSNRTNFLIHSQPFEKWRRTEKSNANKVDNFCEICAKFSQLIAVKLCTKPPHTEQSSANRKFHPQSVEISRWKNFFSRTKKIFLTKKSFCVRAPTKKQQIRGKIMKKSWNLPRDEWKVCPQLPQSWACGVRASPAKISLGFHYDWGEQQQKRVKREKFSIFFPTK